MPDCSFLLDCAARFEAARRDFETLVEGVSDDWANRRPGPDRWSAAECLEHLNVTASRYFPKMEGAIERGRRRRILGRAPYPQRSFLGRQILKVLDPAGNRTFKAPRIFQPRHQGPLDFAAVCRDFRAGLERFDELVERADGLDLGRIRLATPIAPFPRLTLAEAFEIHALHIPRHLAQARAALAAPEPRVSMGTQNPQAPQSTNSTSSPSGG